MAEQLPSEARQGRLLVVHGVWSDAPRALASRRKEQRSTRLAARRRSTVRRFQGGGRVQRAAARRTTRLADPGVGRRVTPISRIRRGAAALTQPHPPPDPVRCPAEKQTAACHRDLSDHMARRVAAHCHRVRRDDANDEACGHHQPESHAESIARRHNTTNPRGLPLPPADESARSRMTAASGATAPRDMRASPLAWVASLCCCKFAAA
jgi:hypothetical protein